MKFDEENWRKTQNQGKKVDLRPSLRVICGCHGNVTMAMSTKTDTQFTGQHFREG